MYIGDLYYFINHLNNEVYSLDAYVCRKRIKGHNIHYFIQLTNIDESHRDQGFWWDWFEGDLIDYMRVEDQ